MLHIIFVCGFEACCLPDWLHIGLVMHCAFALQLLDITQIQRTTDSSDQDPTTIPTRKLPRKVRDKQKDMVKKEKALQKVNKAFAEQEYLRNLIKQNQERKEYSTVL